MQLNNTSRKGALYLRKSRADIEKEKVGKFETLAHHEAELTAMAERMELPIDRVYKEIVSGESIAERTEFQALMEGVQNGEYEYVICHAIDRLGRGDMMEYGWVLSMFQITGTKIVTPGKTYDPTDPFDHQQLQFQMMFSEQELIGTKRRLKAGKEASVRDGQYIAQSAPFGYDKHVRTDRKKTLVPNDDAGTVRKIFELAAQGVCRSAIAKEMNASGVPALPGSVWLPSRIFAIVTNPVYKGIIRWYKTKTVVESRDGMALRKRRVDNRGDAIEVGGLHEPIVSEELWQAANDAIVGNDPRLKRGRELRNPLAGLLKCGSCGMAMSMGRSRDYVRFAHSRDRSMACEHKCRCARYDRVMEAVSSALEDLAGDYMVMATAGENAAEEHERKIASLTKAIEDVERRKDKLVELYTLTDMPMAEYRDRREPLERRHDELAELLEEELKVEPMNPVDLADKLSNVVKLIADESIPAQERNDAIKSVVERIFYYNDDGNIRLEIVLR